MNGLPQFVLNSAFCCLALGLISPTAHAQLTPQQRTADFLALADAYATSYGPYEWKKIARNFDAMDLKPWIEKIERAKDDLEYAEIVGEYVSSLDDAHDSVAFPLYYGGSLPLAVDIYDGKVLIDAINRTSLPAARFPFQIGDEVVRMDGRPVSEWIAGFRKYVRSANQSSTDRSAASLLVSRSQSLIPSLPELPEFAQVEVMRANGDLETYQIPWARYGNRATSFGKPLTGQRQASRGMVWEPAANPDDTLPAHQRAIEPLLNVSVAPRAIVGIGSRFPVWNPPAGFQIRLGASANDFFLSGVFAPADGLRIGYIRIPSMSPTIAVSEAYRLYELEMQYFQANTDGLIVDVMRNPGGSVAFVEELARRTIPERFRTLGFEIRASAGWVYSFEARARSARLTGQQQWVIDLTEGALKDIKQANSEPRGMTGPISLNSTGSLDLEPHPAAYSKPVMVLVDEFSASGGDMFPAILQDNQRAILYGMRTMGAGGNVVTYSSGALTEAQYRITQSLMSRKNVIATSDEPTAQYVENIGVRPEIVSDYMTRENLMTGGRPFVEGFVRAMLNHIRGLRP